MHLSGSVCIVALVVLVIAGGIVSWVEAGDDRGHTGMGETDLETRLGLEAAQDPGFGKPRALRERAMAAAAGGSGRRWKAAALGIPRGSHVLAGVRQGARVPVRAAPGGELIEVAGDETEFGSPTVFGVARIEGRWLGVSTPTLPNHRLGWVRYDPKRVVIGWTDQSIHVSLSARRATLRAGERPLLSFDVTVGAPGTSTPTGRFAVTDLFRGGLNPVYGCCAIALSAIQPNLPADWPGGDRIALHGNGTGQPLGGAVSNGCLRADDKAVSTLIDRVALGTPVFIEH